VNHVRTCFRVGTRRACRVLNLHRSMYLYRSRRPEQAVLRKRIREIAETRVRYGYRRIHILLQREGWSIGRTRVYRLYRLEGLQMRHKPPRRRVMAKLRDDRAMAVAPNDCWSMDWMYDQLFDGRRLWVLTLVNNFSRQDYNDVRLHSAIGERTPMIMFSAHRNTPMGSTVPEVLV
jgi:putative transposase